MATTIINAGLTALDFNDLGERFYDEEDFSFDLPSDNATSPNPKGGTRLIHPVLTDENLARKRQRTALRNNHPSPLSERVIRRVAWGYNTLVPW